MSDIPSYIKCLEICSESNNIFYETTHTIDGFKVSTFNYRLATYQDFVNFDAFELRGLTFIFDESDLIFNYHPLLEKFFNINENESTNYDKLRNKKIKSVLQKEDGSIISFIKLPNGKIFAKSKNSFESDQAKFAQSFFEKNEKIRNFIIECLNSNINPIFELVGPKNRIVVNYSAEDLILLACRNHKGEYVDISSFDLSKPETLSYDLEQLLSLKSEIKDIEGWVVEFEDGQKIKIKTDWYFALHRIFTDYSNRPDYLISLILDEKIDDVLSVLDYQSPNRQFVDEVISITNENINSISNQVDSLVNIYDGDRKKFAIENKDNPLFGIASKVIDGRDKYEFIKDYVKRKTFRLKQANDWLFGG